VIDPVPDAYLCPLCLAWFADVADLSRDHAPPRNVGGSRVVLTCRSCNSHAGHTLDDEIRRAETVRGFVSGKSIPRTAGSVEVDGIALRAEVSASEGRITLAGVPKANDPRVRDAHIAAFDAMVARDPSEQAFRVNIPGFDNARAQAGWLRAAYLIAFAAFGYRYILRPQLDVVRRQVADPDNVYIDRYVLHGHDRPKESRYLGAIERPRSLRAVAVVMGDHFVFLPGFERSPRIYENLASRKHWPLRRDTFRRMNGPAFKWPTSPEFAFDLL
jgi:hypothetical protein